MTSAETTPPPVELGAQAERAIVEAIERLAGDGVIAYPTETVWGLGACADRPRAIASLMDWKGRASDAPMSVLVSSLAAARRLGCRIEPGVERLAEAFWPGPVTLVVPCDGELAPGVARGDGALGLRCSPHPLAAGLACALEQAGLGPLTSTSLNRSGESPARNVIEARALVEQAASGMGTAGAGHDRGRGAAPLIVVAEGFDAGNSTPSSVVDCSGETPKVLRAGAIEREWIEDVWSKGVLGTATGRTKAKRENSIR